MLRRAEPLDATSQKHVEWRTRLSECEGKAEVILGKRRGGRGYGVRQLYFDAEATRFYDNSPYRMKDAASVGLFAAA
jgi:replicative DNA helicase